MFADRSLHNSTHNNFQTYIGLHKFATLHCDKTVYVQHGGRH